MEVERPDAGAFVVSALETPTCIDLLPGIEIVIDLHIDLLADVGRPDTEAIVASPQGLQPSRPGGVQAVADIAVVDRRHDAKQFRDVSGRI